ncbi:hypothetical protein Dimus_007860 [Dionaea muscipula]
MCSILSSSGKRFQIQAGFQFDYVFDWTILKYQQSQVIVPPPRRVIPGGATSGIHNAVANLDRQTGSSSYWWCSQQTRGFDNSQH